MYLHNTLLLRSAECRRDRNYEGTCQVFYHLRTFVEVVRALCTIVVWS